MVNKILLNPNTTLFPVPVVLITCGTQDTANVFTLNRIARCNAEPPMISISVRPSRASHSLITENKEFIVNVPWPEMEFLTDYVGSTTICTVDKWAETGLRISSASLVSPPLLVDCPVNLECRVVDQIKLPSHTLFIGEIMLIHAAQDVMNSSKEVDFGRVKGGLTYRSGVVRERPVENFKPELLLKKVREWRSQLSENS